MNEQNAANRAMYETGRVTAQIYGPIDEEPKNANQEEALRTLAVTVDKMRRERIEFASHLGFGDDIETPAAELHEMVDPIEEAFQAERDHFECPSVCNECGEWLADTVCEHCHGSGHDNVMSANYLAHVECEWCAGAGKVHPGCAGKSYADLVAEVKQLQAVMRQVKELHRPQWIHGCCMECGADITDGPCPTTAAIQTCDGTD